MSHLLDLLLTDVIRDLPALLSNADAWESEDVTQSTRMERLRTLWRDGQIFLQRFLPTEAYPWHGHPWPSAYLALSGEVKMGSVIWTGIYSPTPEVEAASVTYLTLGSKYEMDNEEGFHYMKCMSDEALGLMLTGPKWSGHCELEYPPLSPERKEALIGDFRFFFCPLR
jgi:hypothetical protein